MTITLEDAVARGMMIAYHARQQPHVPAVITQFGNRTFGELNQQANRLVRALRDAGIGEGDSIAVVIRNRPEFIEALTAANRSGIRFTPMNFHLTAEEIGYVVDDCEAKRRDRRGVARCRCRGCASCAPKARLRVGGRRRRRRIRVLRRRHRSHTAPRHRRSRASARRCCTPPARRVGRKACIAKRASRRGRNGKARSPAIARASTSTCAPVPRITRRRSRSTSPRPSASGVGVVFMDKWDAEETLRLIDATRRHAHPHGRDDVPSPVAVARDRPSTLRPVEPALRDPRRRADAGAREARR